MVGGDGDEGTRPSASVVSGLVSASDVRSSVRNERERRLRTMVGNFSETCTTKPTMKTQAPK